MLLRELTESVAGLKFLKPGELRGSYTDQQLRNLGFKQARNKSWFIPQTRWDYLVKNRLIEGVDFKGTNDGMQDAAQTDHTYQEAKAYVRGNYSFARQYRIRRVEPGYRAINRSTGELDPNVLNRTQNAINSVDSAVDYLQLKKNPLMSGSVQISYSLGYSWMVLENTQTGIAILYYQDRGMGADEIIIAGKTRDNFEGAKQIFLDAGVIVLPKKKVAKNNITESTSPEATIKAIIADIGHPVSAVYSQLANMADKFVASKGNLKGFNMIAGGVGSRWYNQFYFNRLQRELYDLVKYYPRHSEILKQFLSNRPETFGAISRELPETLVQFANKINNKDLARAASRWIEVRKQYVRTLNQLEADAEDEEDEEPTQPAQPNVTGQQASQAEQIVADVLRRLPRNIAGDIRNAIARSPNKLLALQQELQRRNITVGEGLSEGWRDWVMGAGIGAAALGGIGAAYDYLNDKTADSQRQVAAGTIQQTTPAKPQSLLAKATRPLEKTLIKAAEKAGLVGTELQQFIAQCAHETMDFQTLEELGDNKRFAHKYDMKYNPAKAKELGNIKPGDGIRYKGRGYIQLTGRYNYRDAGKALGLPLEDHPELAARPDIAVKVSLWFWGKRVAPRVDDFTNVPKSTKPINPALHGLKSRQEKFDKYSSSTTPSSKS